jgi:hypothetical protein
LHSGDAALLAVGVSRHERRRSCSAFGGDAVSFSEPMWLAPHDVDDLYFAMLLTGVAELSAQEADELARVFGKMANASWAVELRPAVPHAKKGPFPERKRPQGCRLGPGAPRGVPMDEREVHRLDAGWRESVTET